MAIPLQIKSNARVEGKWSMGQIINKGKESNATIYTQDGRYKDIMSCNGGQWRNQTAPNRYYAHGMVDGWIEGWSFYVQSCTTPFAPSLFCFGLPQTLSFSLHLSLRVKSLDLSIHSLINSNGQALHSIVQELHLTII